MRVLVAQSSDNDDGVIISSAILLQSIQDASLYARIVRTKKRNDDKGGTYSQSTTRHGGELSGYTNDVEVAQAEQLDRHNTRSPARRPCHATDVQKNRLGVMAFNLSMPG